MPGPAETILVTVDVVANSTRLVELQKQLNENKAATAALNAAFKAGQLTADEYAAGQVRLKAAAAATTQEQRVLTAANQAQQKTTDAAAGSIEQLRAQLALGTVAYNKLSREERDNTEAGQRLQAQNKATSDSLKELEGAVGDTRRNVGNYKDSLKDAIKESGFLGGITQKVTEAQEGFSKAQTIAKAAIGGNVTALGFLRLALLATGLGAVVVILGSLVAFLTRTQEGTDLVSRKFAGLKAVVSTLIGVAAEFGGALFKALENPKQAITDLVEFIQGNLLNRLKAFAIIFNGITSGSINKVSEGLFQLSTGVTDVTGKLSRYTAELGKAAAAGEKIEAENQRILRSERALNVERSEARARIEGLKKASDDSTKSVSARATAAREAARIENALLAQQLKLQDDKIKNEQAGQRLRKVVTAAYLDALAELRAARADTQQESLTLQTELQNKTNSLATEGAALSETARKKADDAKLASIEAEIEAQKQREDAADKFRDETDKGRIDKLAKDEKARVDALAADKAAYDAQLAALDRFLARMSAKAAADFANGLLSKAGYDEALLLQQEISNGSRLLLATKFAQDTTKLEEQQSKDTIARLERERGRKERIADAEIGITESRVAAGQAGADAIISAFGEESAAGEAAVVAKKALAVIDIGINLQKTLSANAVAAAELAASVPGPVGVALGASYLTTNNILAFVQAAAGVAAVLAFAEGGRVEGPGTETSDSIPALLSKSEHVLTAKEVRGMGGHENVEHLRAAARTGQLPAVLSFLSAQVGGPGFATGGAIGRTVTSDGGLQSRLLISGPQIDYQQLAAAMSEVNLNVGVSAFMAAKKQYDTPRAMTTLGRRN